MIADLPPSHPAAAACEQILLQLYLFTVRYDEIRRRKIREWNFSHKPESLRVSWLIDETKSFPVGATRDRLEQAGRDAPDDDRVWLGKANLATRTGRAEEAAAWLRAMPPPPPADPAVWLARLDWAVAFDRVDDGHGCGAASAGRFPLREPVFSPSRPGSPPGGAILGLNATRWTSSSTWSRGMPGPSSD